jgi:hypothetical protein
LFTADNFRCSSIDVAIGRRINKHCRRKRIINVKLNERRFPEFLWENFAIKNDKNEHKQNNGNII